MDTPNQHLEQINREGVSIIIGARNEYPQVAMTICNLMEDMHQSGIEKWEIILMDNGSEDETSRFFHWKPVSKSGRWRYQYSPRGLVHEGRLRIFFDPVLSNVGTRNKGVLKAKYENIIFSDAHIIVNNNTILNIISTLIEYGGIVHAPISWMGASYFRTDAGYQYSYKVGEKIWGCVDDQTQLLTSDGWKYYDEVSMDTLFATVCMDTVGRIEYQKPTDLTIHRNYEHEAIKIDNNDVDMLLTPDHRTLLEGNKIVSAKEVTELDKIPTCGIGFHHDWESGDFDAVLGWVLTDGGYDYKDGKYPRVRIFQKKELQKEVIRSDLKAAKIDYFEFEDKNNKSIFTINARDSRKIVDMFPNRGLTVDYVSNMQKSRAEAMLNRMMLADGHKKIFYKTDRDFVDAFQMLCVHAGMSTKYRYKPAKAFKGNRYGKRGIYEVTVGNTRQYKSKIKKVLPNRNVMWCPTLPNGTVVARRNGKVYFTGNTWNKVKVADEPFYIPICGHAFLAVRRRQFLKYRGYPYAQRVYGGGEPYLDTKYWMLGSTSMMDPRCLVYHLSAGRGYSWHSHDLIHNMFLVSYILGGEEWADRILITYYNRYPTGKPVYDLLKKDALEGGQEDKDWLDRHKKYTFEQVLGLDKSKIMENMTKKDIEKLNEPWWCTKCTKRGYADHHIMRPWDYKNEELHGTHRSFVAEFKLRKDEKDQIFIGNTKITDPQAIQIAKKYL